MIKKYFIIFFFTLIPFLGHTQSLSISVQRNTVQNTSSTFLLNKESVQLGVSQINFSSAGVTVKGFLGYGVSPDLSTVGIVTNAKGQSKALVFNAGGDTLSTFSVTELSSNDPSIAVYPFNNGGILVRDNIANFSLYDSFGKIVNTISNSSQSKGGEAISEAVMDEEGQTIVIYNPKVKRNGKLGSEIRVVGPDRKAQRIFYSQDHFIKDVRISDDGQFIAVLTSGGAGDEVIFMDRFGNKLNTIDSDEDLRGLRISHDAQYLTLFSGNRVMVYQTLSGDREASSSFRAPVILAEYFPDDQIIMGLTGQYSESSGDLRDGEFHAISVSKRKIARKKMNTSVTFNDALQQDFTRKSGDLYLLEGASRVLEIKASF